MKRAPSKPWLLVVGGVLVLLLSPVAGAWVIAVVPLRTRHAEQRRALDAATEDFHQQRWGRPVLRGEPRDGNAFEAQIAAITALDDLPGELLREAVERLPGAPPSPPVLALVEEHGDDLLAYRATTANAWSWGDYPVETASTSVWLNHAPHLAVTRLLTVTAAGAEPGECLRIGADVIRLGQDRTAGRSIVALMVHHAGVAEVFDVLARCLTEAPLEDVRRAAQELEVLALHPAATGYAMEVEALTTGAMFAELLGDLESLPTDVASFEDWWDASDVLGAWAELASAPAERRAIGDDYPTDIVRYVAWEATLGSMGNPTLAIAAPRRGSYLRRDASTRTRVRMLWALARLRSGQPRTIFMDPRMHDPLTGAPIETHETSAGLELRSAGPDGVYTRDDESDDMSLLVPFE